MKNSGMKLGLKTYYKSAIALRIAGVTLVLTSLIILMCKTIRYNSEIIDKDKKITNILPIVDSVEYNNELRKRGVLFVDKYIKLTNSNKYKEILYSYADTINKFYTKRDVSRSEVENEIKKHQNRVPYDSVTYNPSDIIVSNLPVKKLKIIVPAMYSKNSTTTPFESIYIVIVLNEKDEIISISNYKDFNTTDL